MRRSREAKLRTHERIVDTAAAQIREQGIEGPGVAEIMLAAGLTHGGFYKHFRSRDELIAEAAHRAFAVTGRALNDYATDEPDQFAGFVDGYVSEEHRDAPGADRCSVSALIGDVGRADDGVRAGYDAVVERFIATIEGMLGGGQGARRQATIAVSMLVGSLGLARAVDDDALSAEILRTAREALKRQRIPYQEVS